MINNSNLIKMNKRVFSIIKNISKKGISSLNKMNHHNKNNFALFKLNFKSFSDYTPLTLPKKDLYKTLGINMTSDLNEIKQGYYKKAKEYHPDKFASNILQFINKNNIY